MQDDSYSEAPRGQPVRWKAAWWAGLIAAGLFFMVSRGIPWSSGVPTPTVVGRELQSPEIVSSSASLAAAALHVFVSILYALAMAPLIHRMRTMPAVLTGALIGCVLYLINHLIFTEFLTPAPGQRESVAFLTHIAFGMVAAAVYKGLSQRRAVAV
jgi:hypothetical protein